MHRQKSCHSTTWRNFGKETKVSFCVVSNFVGLMSQFIALLVDKQLEVNIIGGIGYIFQNGDLGTHLVPLLSCLAALARGKQLLVSVIFFLTFVFLYLQPTPKMHSSFW